MANPIKKIFNNSVGKIFGPKHDWKYVYEEYKNTFLNEETSVKHREFRICRKCGQAEVPQYLDDCGLYWSLLGKQERIILSKKIIDKGDYYLLDRNRKISYGGKHD